MGEKLISLSKKKWRGIVGVLFIAIFVLFTVVFDGSHIAQALKNSGYGYGYGYSGTPGLADVATYGYGYQYSDYVPAAVSGVTYEVGSTTATLNWSYPTTTVGADGAGGTSDDTSLDNPSGVCYTYGEAAVQSCTRSDNWLAYTITSADLSSLTAETLYYYVIQAYDDNYTYGTAYTGTFTTLPTSTTTTTSTGGGGGGAVLPPPDTEVTDGVTD